MDIAEFKYFCRQGNMAIANAKMHRVSWKVDSRQKWVYMFCAK